MGQNMNQTFLLSSPRSGGPRSPATRTRARVVLSIYIHRVISIWPYLESTALSDGERTESRIFGTSLYQRISVQSEPDYVPLQLLCEIELLSRPSVENTPPLDKTCLSFVVRTDRAKICTKSPNGQTLIYVDESNVFPFACIGSRSCTHLQHVPYFCLRPGVVYVRELSGVVNLQRSTHTVCASKQLLNQSQKHPRSFDLPHEQKFQRSILRRSTAMVRRCCGECLTAVDGPPLAIPADVQPL